MTRVVNAKYAPKGWKGDSSFVDVRRARNGRVGLRRSNPGYFGNPYKVGALSEEGTLDLAAVLSLFRTYAEAKVASDPDYRREVRSLVGKTLVCACAPKEGLTKDDPHVCHGQILAELAERLNKAVAA